MDHERHLTWKHLIGELVEIVVCYCWFGSWPLITFDQFWSIAALPLSNAMMSVWLNYPRQVQLLSRILSCNFSSLASCSSLKPSYLKCDISRVLPTKIELVDQGKQIGRVGSSHAVPFVFPRYFDHQRVTCQATEVINISGSDGSSKPSQPKGKPSTEQLETIYLKLSEDVSSTFSLHNYLFTLPH